MDNLEISVKEAYLAKKRNMYNSAILNAILAMEFIIIEALKSKGIDIYTNNTDHTFYSLTTEVKNKSLISQKMYEKLTATNKLRRISTHSKSGDTIEKDAEYVISVMKGLINEIYSNDNNLDFRKFGDSLETKIISQLDPSFMGIISVTNELKRTYSMDILLNFALNMMSSSALVVLGIIIKYKPHNQEELINLLQPLQIKYDLTCDTVRRLCLSGVLFIEHPNDIKRGNSLKARIFLDKKLEEELTKFYKAKWPLIFKNFSSIEADYDSIRQ